MSSHGHAPTKFHTARGAEADPSGGPTVFAGVVGVLVLVASIFALEALFHYKAQGDVQSKVYEANYQERLARQQAQQESLARYTIDKKTGTATIPIDRAMDLVVQDLSRRPG